MILIFTNKEDVHPTPVIDILNSWNVPVFRLNTEALLTDYAFCWQSNAKTIAFWIKNIQTGLLVKSNDITSVWDRRPETPSELFFQNTPEINKHNLKEALGFLQFLRYYIKGIFSIGSITNDRIAASKMLQLKMAHEIGLTIPNTCFSNRKKDILEFADNYEYLILKSIENDCVWNETEEMEYVFYAQKVPSSTLVDLPDEAFAQTVHYVQNYVEKVYELRITVVGREVFACKIDSQAMEDDKGKIDWRQGYDYGLKHEIYELPQDIANKCILFLQKMELNFGCFDFICTPEGKYVFLECNPNGQWLWIEQMTGLPIANAIATALSRKN